MYILQSRCFPINAFVKVFLFFICLFNMNYLAAAEESAPREPTEVVNDIDPKYSEHFPFEETNIVEEEADDFFKQFIKMLGTLALLLALLIGSSWILKGMVKKQQLNMSSSDSIKVLERCPLSNTGGLYIVDIFDKSYLIGESPQGITLLKEFEETNDS